MGQDKRSIGAYRSSHICASFLHCHNGIMASPSLERKTLVPATLARNSSRAKLCGFQGRRVGSGFVISSELLSPLLPHPTYLLTFHVLFSTPRTFSLAYSIFDMLHLPGLSSCTAVF